MMLLLAHSNQSIIHIHIHLLFGSFKTRAPHGKWGVRGKFPGFIQKSMDCLYGFIGLSKKILTKLFMRWNRYFTPLTNRYKR
jgi:hypothetical protein